MKPWRTTSTVAYLANRDYNRRVGEDSVVPYAIADQIDAKQQRARVEQNKLQKLKQNNEYLRAVLLGMIDVSSEARRALALTDQCRPTVWIRGKGPSAVLASHLEIKLVATFPDVQVRVYDDSQFDSPLIASRDLVLFCVTAYNTEHVDPTVHETYVNAQSRGATILLCVVWEAQFPTSTPNYKYSARAPNGAISFYSGAVPQNALLDVEQAFADFTCSSRTHDIFKESDSLNQTYAMARVLKSVLEHYQRTNAKYMYSERVTPGMLTAPLLTVDSAFGDDDDDDDPLRREGPPYRGGDDDDDGGLLAPEILAPLAVVPDVLSSAVTTLTPIVPVVLSVVPGSVITL